MQVTTSTSIFRSRLYDNFLLLSDLERKCLPWCRREDIGDIGIKRKCERNYQKIHDQLNLLIFYSHYVHLPSKCNYLDDTSLIK